MLSVLSDSVCLSVCLSIYLSVYLKSQDYGDVSAGAQQGRLTMLLFFLCGKVSLTSLVYVL